MLEGMATGLPVLQKYDPINGDQVQEGVNGFVFRDAAELKQKLAAYLAMSAEEKAALARSTRESVAKKGYETLAENLLQVYADAIEHRRQGKGKTHMTLKLRRNMKNTVGKILRRPK
jgi:1,2-diacylglycerol 3-alpha-glucosyltransferase